MAIHIIKHPSAALYLSTVLNEWVPNPHRATKYSATRMKEYLRDGVITDWIEQELAISRFNSVIGTGGNVIDMEEIERNETRRLIAENVGRVEARKGRADAASEEASPDDALGDWARGMAGVN